MTEQTRQRIGSLLRAYRTAAKLSLNSLHKKSGVSRQMISYIEQGKRNPTLILVVQLTQALGVNPVEFLREATRHLPDITGNPNN